MGWGGYGQGAEGRPWGLGEVEGLTCLVSQTLGQS